MTAAAVAAALAFLASWHVLNVSTPGSRVEFWGAVALFATAVLAVGLTYLAVTTT
ncbi:hypothetical protein SEA_MARIOKART_82 [Gordonia phage Mariokart]|nr:hypothetical protein SEA_MARIOKART_82 [Gordonia phage Mariokart]